MVTLVLLLRGINVGGKNKLPMADLREVLRGCGCVDPKTYIQSGNAVFGTDKEGMASLTKKIHNVIEKKHGFSPQAFILTATELQSALDKNPFPEALAAPNTLHLSFLAAPIAKLDTARLDALATQTEQYKLEGNVFYFYAPDGIGRSKLAAKVEKILGVAVTARNLRTVIKLTELTAAYSQNK